MLLKIKNKIIFGKQPDKYMKQICTKQTSYTKMQITLKFNPK